MGQEHNDKGVDVVLGPVVGPLGRSPEGGRNWEGFSPDPYLSGQAIYHTVQGVQAAGVVACTKHFIGNEQEHYRMNVSSNIDDVTLHELYLWPFADAVRAGTGAIMCSYNQVNNSFACQNSVRHISLVVHANWSVPVEQRPKRRTWVPRLRNERLVGTAFRCGLHTGWSGYEHAGRHWIQHWPVVLGR
jgi:hypothetical protein